LAHFAFQTQCADGFSEAKLRIIAAGHEARAANTTAPEMSIRSNSS
jgi:hypothetical protein